MLGIKGSCGIMKKSLQASQPPDCPQFTGHGQIILLPRFKIKELKITIRLKKYKKIPHLLMSLQLAEQWVLTNRKIS